MNDDVIIIDSDVPNANKNVIINIFYVEINESILTDRRSYV